MPKLAIHPLVSLTLALGALGGATLVLADGLVGNGKYILIPYALLVVGMVAVLRGERIAAFSARFAVGLGAFTISSLALYVAIAMSPTTASLPLLGHGWRLAMVLLFGVLVSLPAARISAPPRELAGST